MTQDEFLQLQSGHQKSGLSLKLYLQQIGTCYSTYNYWRKKYCSYLEDGMLLLDNNLAENEIRPITLGRKNYLFCGNHEAAENMAVVCSLLATCRNHDVNPRDYLNDVIGQMPYHAKASHEELIGLLPHKWKLTHPEAVMTKTT